MSDDGDMFEHQCNDGETVLLTIDYDSAGARTMSGKLIGELQFRRIESDEFNEEIWLESADMSMLDKKYLGQGIATALLRRFVEFYGMVNAQQNDGQRHPIGQHLSDMGARWVQKMRDQGYVVDDVDRGSGNDSVDHEDE